MDNYLFDKYEIQSLLGQGSQARVYLARRLRDSKLVTIKQLDIESVSNWKEYELFHREAEILSHLDVDGVAKFYESLENLDGDSPCSYIVQEYIDGKSVRTMLQNGHRFSTAEVYDILIQLLTILFQLQNRQGPIIHRDIKPSNIMLTPRDSGYKVTLIDFGAVANPQVQSGGSTIAGTYGYMPPEQLMGRPVPASDIYALAAVAVELFTGISPADLPVKDFRLIFEPEMQNQPHELVATLRQMLEPNADNRYANIVKLIETFKNYQSGTFKSSLPVRVENRVYERRLKDVDSVGAPGNIDLWQALPETVPRNIPKTYDFNNWNLTHVIASETLSNKYILKHLFIFLFISAVFQLIIVSTFVGTSLGVLLLVLNLVLVLIYGKLLISRNTTSRTEINGTEINSMKWVGSYSARDKYQKLDRQYDNSDLESLIRNGRKTIATIVKIEYIEADVYAVKPERHYVATPPMFGITYKFNPPDDIRKEDLIHRCIVYTEPENHYKVGDPFPILYNIRDKGFDEMVLSMPFPFPVEYTDVNHVIYKSCAHEDFWTLAMRIRESDDEFLNEIIERRNNHQMLKQFISGISYNTLDSTDMSLFISLLRCFFESELYCDIHKACMRVFIQYGSYLPIPLRSSVTTIIQNYLKNMCKNGVLKSPDALIYLVNFITEYSGITKETQDLFFNLMQYESVHSIVRNSQNSYIHQMILSQWQLIEYHKDSLDMLIENMVSRYSDSLNLTKLMHTIIEYFNSLISHASIDRSIINLIPRLLPKETIEKICNHINSISNNYKHDSKIAHETGQFLNVFVNLYNNCYDPAFRSSIEAMDCRFEYLSLCNILNNTTLKSLHPMAIRGLKYSPDDVSVLARYRADLPNMVFKDIKIKRAIEEALSDHGINKAKNNGILKSSNGYDYPGIIQVSPEDGDVPYDAVIGEAFGETGGFHNLKTLWHSNPMDRDTVDKSASEYYMS